MSDGSQKFIARNRAPRVQIEYDVELYGAEKKVQLPFVMGVMSDLAGKSLVTQPAVADRKFLEIDADNFDERMKAMAPRVAFAVPNSLTGEGNMEVDLTFESIDDFSPGAIAARVDALKPLLEARTQLQNLMTYMDGKSGAEALVEGILANPALQAGLAGRASDGDADAALDALRAMAPPDDAPAEDVHADALSALRAAGDANATQERPVDETGGVLAGLALQEPDMPAEDTKAADILSGLADAAPEVTEPGDAAQSATLDALHEARPVVAEEVDSAGDVLAGLAEQVPNAPAEDDGSADVLSGLADAAPEVSNPVDEDPTGALDALRETGPTPQHDDDTTGEVLADLAHQDLADNAGETDLSSTDAMLDELAATAPAAGSVPDPEAEILGALSDLDAPPEPDPGPDLDAMLGDLAPPAPEPDTAGADALASLAVLDVPEPDNEADTDALLGDLAATAPEVDAAPDESLAALDSLGDIATPEPAPEPDLDDLLGDLAAPAPEPEAADMGADALASLADLDVPEPEDDGDTDALLGDLAGADPEVGAAPDESLAALDSLGDIATPEPAPAPDLADLLGDLAAPAPEPDAADTGADALASLADLDVPEPENEADTDALLGDLAATAPEVDAAPDESLAALDSLGDLATPDPDPDLDDLLGDLTAPAPAAQAGEASEPLSEQNRSQVDTGAPESGPIPDVDDLIGDISGPVTGPVTGLATGAPLAEGAPAAGEGDLDDLLADLGADLSPASSGEDDAPLDDLGADLGGGSTGEDGLGDLLADLGTQSAAGSVDDHLSELDGGQTASTQEDAQGSAQAQMAAPGLAFGAMSGDRPDPVRLNRRRFRMAILGDFSGRAARGAMESGDDLARRRAILLDPDTVEDVIAGFATRLVLPLGKDGAGIEVNLRELDDLHPDELYENVALFSELVSLRQQLSSGATAESAASTLRAWGEAHGTPIEPPKTRSAGNAVPADRKLTDFQQLIGDTSATLTQPGPLDDLLARIVGPHIRAVPDADTVAMQKAVEEALAGAMRTLLHHPEFQSVEAQWRSVDLIARSIETDDTLDVILYDISAEEIAADLAAHEDLSQSALARLLTDEPLDVENGRGGYSALVGLYTFEETPPHAELLARIARVAAHVDAPFLAALASGTMDTPKEERHPLTAQSWDALCAMPEAGYVGLATPRFLLRRPYGAKTEPCYEFDFEEFTMAEGLSGLLWANPVVLVAILLARSFRQNGQAMQLGSVMSLGDMPYHVVEDRYGDQVALPCTERNLTLESIEAVMARRLMPVVSVKGRDEVRLASFQSLAGEELRGPWSGAAPPPPSAPPSAGSAVSGATEAAPPPEADVAADLDAILAGFDDSTAPKTVPEQAGTGDSDVDAELAALLEGL